MPGLKSLLIDTQIIHYVKMMYAEFFKSVILPCDVGPNPQTTWVWFSEPLLAYTWHYFRIYILGVIFSVIEIHEGIIVVCVHSWAGGFPTERPPTKYKIHFKRFHHSKHKNICILIEQNLSIINIHHQIEAFITIWCLFFTKKIFWVTILLIALKVFLGSASADQNCDHMRHLANFTHCARIAPCSIWFTIQW